MGTSSWRLPLGGPLCSNNGPEGTQPPRIDGPLVVTRLAALLHAAGRLPRGAVSGHIPVYFDIPLRGASQRLVKFVRPKAVVPAQREEHERLLLLRRLLDPMEAGWQAALATRRGPRLGLLHLDRRGNSSCPWSPPSHLPHTCRLCGECATVSSAASTGANRCARCAQVAACPWPEPPAGPRRRTEEEALRRRIEGAHTPSHEQAGPAGAALLWIHVHLQDPTSVAHLSHVFAP